MGAVDRGMENAFGAVPAKYKDKQEVYMIGKKNLIQVLGALAMAVVLLCLTVSSYRTEASAATGPLCLRAPPLLMPLKQLAAWHG